MIKIERGGRRERRLVIVRDKRRKVIFLSCRLHLLACHAEHGRPDAQTNAGTPLPRMSMNYPWNNGSSSY